MTGLLYTIDRANATLPLVRSIVRDVVQLTSRLAPARDDVERLRDDPACGEDERNEASRRVREIAEDLGACVAELEQLSVRVGDATRGICDFPAEIDGELVYLCWMLGEEQISWFHGVDDGFAGRRPVPQPVGV